MILAIAFECNKKPGGFENLEKNEVVSIKFPKFESLKQHPIYMKIPSLAQLKKELSYLNEKELVDLIIDLSKFSRDNKSYLFFKLSEKDNPGLYLEMVQEELELDFQTARGDHSYYAKKSAQKLRRKMNKLLKLSKVKTDQIEVLLFFCEKLKEYGFLRHRNQVLDNIYQMQLGKAVKLISGLHEDLQFDYEGRVEELT